MLIGEKQLTVTTTSSASSETTATLIV
jgi:hypothetical protein